MDKVKAKFQCSSVIPTAFGSVVANFHAVYGNGEENKSFSEATPSANLSMVISDSAPAKDFFVQGKDYYLTFEAAE